jgi:DNA-binding transcriptional LysR family regulator
MSRVPNLAASLRIRQLQLVAAIAEHGQLSLAARALSVTQPAASRMLSEIEAAVGEPLFDRHARGMTPTPLGEGLARRSRNVVDELGEAAAEISRIRLGKGGVVRVGAVTGAAVGYVVPAIRTLKSIAPEVELHVDVATSEDLAPGLVAMQYDMVLARLPAELRPDQFDVSPARDEQVMVVARRANPVAAMPRLSLGDISDAEWVMQKPGAPVRRAVEDAFHRLGAPVPRNVTNTASLLVVLAMVSGSDAVTAVSAEVAGLLTAARSDLVVLPVDEPITVTPYWLITQRDRRLSPAAARFRNLLLEALPSRNAKP